MREGKIGGPWKIVEIDESKFWRRKYNVGHFVEGQWVFGGIQSCRSVEICLCYMATKRKLRQEWLMNRDFQPWLSPLENDPTKAFCSTCKTQMNAELTTIKRHKTSRLHVKQLQETETQEAAQSDRPDEAARISAGISQRQLQIVMRMAMEIWKEPLLRQIECFLLNRNLGEERNDVLKKLVLWPMMNHSKWVQM
ncbi:hypothetical protein Pcinc_017915 [Petrolisthes cinctipes]|uniref:Uncharacterized protein n=1 Tax=Petrolisthes cinctipes TaxID=88211 RepID=A0AAE1KPD9_PETCI|nr:hypothetical protein Pcinc_017915 [Petrolisthes cinctipes]